MPRWAYNPHTAGKSIRPSIRARTERRILDYAAKHYSGKFTRIAVRFHGGTFTLRVGFHVCIDLAESVAELSGLQERRGKRARLASLITYYTAELTSDST